MYDCLAKKKKSCMIVNWINLRKDVSPENRFMHLCYLHKGKHKSDVVNLKKQSCEWLEMKGIHVGGECSGRLEWLQQVTQISAS